MVDGERNLNEENSAFLRQLLPRKFSYRFARHGGTGTIALDGGAVPSGCVLGPMLVVVREPLAGTGNVKVTLESDGDIHAEGSISYVGAGQGWVLQNTTYTITAVSALAIPATTPAIVTTQRREFMMTFSGAVTAGAIDIYATVFRPF